MVCGIEFRGSGAKREVGVSVATTFSEESIKKLIGVVNKEGKKTIELDVAVATAVCTEQVLPVKY